MPKVSLDRAIIYRGTLYMPGDVDCDADTAEALTLRMEDLRAAEAPRGSGEALGVAPADLSLPPAVEAEGGTPVGVLDLSLDVVQLLEEGGLSTVEAVRDASDERLMVISGIAEGRVRQIREALSKAGG